MQSSLGFRRVFLCGVPVDDVSQAELSQALICAARDGQGGLVVTPNVSIARELGARNPGVAVDDVLAAPADGKPIAILCDIAGFGRIRRVTGVDLVEQLLVDSAYVDLPIYVLGSGGPSLASIANEASRRAPVIGQDLPFAEHDAPIMVAAVKEAIQGRRGIVLLCLGFPKQEMLATHLMTTFPEMVFVGVGASADILSGRFRRAPRILQWLGFEWVWRMSLEPRRLWRRYILGDVPWIASAAIWAMRRRRTVGGSQ